jgi:CheY-like chemotaxis protein
LVVDDNELNQKVACDMLNFLGCITDVANSGESALDAVQKKKYNLIFMDCQMPGMDGFIASKKIRELEMNQKQNGPTESKIIVALTANALKGTRERCIKAGMNDYLTKPFNFEQLKNILAKYVSNQIPGTGPENLN